MSHGPSQSAPPASRIEVGLDLLHRVTEATNRPGTLEATIRSVLEVTCAAFGWAVGHVFLRRGEFLVPSDVWCLPDRFERFREATRGMAIEVGSGLVGRAAEGRPARMEDVSRDPGFLRREEAEGLATGLAFPVLAGDDLVGVMVFFSESREEADATIDETMESVGVLLGRAIERERAERRVAVIARASDDALWEFDAVRDRRWTSDGFRQLVGVGSDRVRTREEYEALIHPADRERVLESSRRAIESGAETWVEEYRIVTPAGETLWVFDRMVLEYDPEGRLLRATGSMMDVTERRRTEERLRRRTHDLGERIKEITCLYDISRMLLGNEEGLEAELLQAVADRLPAGWQHPEITEARIGYGEIRGATAGFEETPWILRQAFAAGGTGGVVEVAYREDPREGGEGPVFLGEEERLLEAIAGRLEETARRRAMQETIRRSEAYYRAVVENATDVVTILDPDGSIRYESPPVERVLGYLPEERIGRSAFEDVHPDDVDDLRRSLERLIGDGDDLSSDVRFRVRHRDGSWRHMESSGVDLRADAHVGGIVAVSRDITDRVHLEEQLLQSQKMEAVGRLAGGVAHDFNNALTVVRGYAQLLRDEPALVRWSEEIDEILHSSARASNLTRQLLAFGRKSVEQPETVAVDRIVGGMERMLRRLIGERVVLATDLRAGPASVSIDPGHLEQLLMNLVVNARDAMPGGGTVTIRTLPVESEGEAGLGSVRLEVEDEGVGIGDEVRAHLFEPFFTTREEGSGLGLSIVYGIVERAGGGIEVESAPGEGATFRVTLPRVGSASDPGSDGEEPAPKPEDAVGERILLVEDEESVRRLARAMLESAGHRVVAVPDAVTARERVEVEDPFDLLLTDVVLPGRSGYELAETLRESRPDLPVLFMSGYPEDERVRAMVESDEARFLQKPFDRVVLLGEVSAMLAAD